MNKAQLKKVIKQEIEWCKKNHYKGQEKYEIGFIAGLEQAILFIDSLTPNQQK